MRGPHLLVLVLSLFVARELLRQLLSRGVDTIVYSVRVGFSILALLNVVGGGGFQQGFGRSWSMCSSALVG